ncbi:hypothetical protein [Apilactobacillus timberlakei]|uniref:hypothetical protein n=1 Tax=Apilactobacillus timberlakei TaxID=2008380 RepID=UPI00112ED87A|nr:hypothetical protein [Apilactobacillus timberlakei]TPR16699.1 hypothetical protein DYZ95_06895 [Apilactobacillus timberlakei]
MENSYKTILLRQYSATSYSLSVLGADDPNFENVPELMYEFWTELATHPDTVDYHYWFIKITAHGDFNNWVETV